MIRFTKILIFLIFPLQVFSQFDYCDSLVIGRHQTLFDTEGIQHTVDYINKFFPEQKRYISDRNELEPINLWWNTDSTMLFENKENTIRISFANRNIDPTDIFYPKSEGDTFSKIREYNEGSPYGVTSEDTTAVLLAEISINGKQIPESYFSDLLNPNRYETVLSVKPIEVYKSKCGQYLYIYLFGKLNTDIMTLNEAIDFSYMAKLVVTVKGYYVNRIVIPGDKLKYFGYGDCPYFIGF